DVIPHMAKKYGFKYELVQYKWPRWLYQQTEKQRIIWGYKILFLDVLFPLAVDKIIFVDADQRVSLSYVSTLLPVAFSPEIKLKSENSSSYETGQRKVEIQLRYKLKQVWTQGAGAALSWNFMLNSMLIYDLTKFVQDLPNNMIHQVAIKSLPQEWLWCETWCDDESKKKAKTIDLCNNPETKEPKLKAAARIVPEWVDYDSEIR
ncbi:UGGG2 glucosyltransferase, partial [Corythaeola cristata]|nr:UGGG2 glucosyltransferase [Corythaeola cristata]